MQEAVVDYAGQAIIATDMGKDFHSANLLRQAIDADKLTAAIGSDGKSIPLEAAYEHSLQSAPSIADNKRPSLSNAIGRASFRGRRGPYVLTTWVAGLIKKKNK